MTGENYSFPRGFVWGAATAAYQIEGAWDINGKGPSIWDTFSHTAGKIANGDTGDIAVDHYHRFAEDFTLMKQMDIKAYRFSLSWPRIMPTGKGEINQLGLDFYDRLVDGLLSLNIEPYITLYHWDLPQAMQDVGGWVNRDVCGYFADYTAVVMRRLGDRVENFITINEPWVVAALGNITGEHAPGLRDRKVGAQVAHHLLVAHGMSTQAIRSISSDAKVGISLYLQPAEPESPEDPKSVNYANMLWQRDAEWFLDPLFKASYPAAALRNLGSDAPTVLPNDFALISQRMDFLGVNYYTRSLISSKGEKVNVTGAEHTDMGWEVVPGALSRMLIKMNQEYHLPPIFITENGCAVPDTLTPEGHVHDVRRIKYLHDHLVELRVAMREGVRVNGYFVWSLIDNFEWAHGFSKRFGLIYVDYPTLKRHLKDSAYWYEKVIRRNEVHR